MNKLFYTASGRPVQKGDIVSLDGQVATVTGMREGYTSNSTGRVYLSVMDDKGDEVHLEYYPSVIGAAWHEVAIDKPVDESLQPIRLRSPLYPDDIMENVRESMDLEPHDTSNDELIEQMGNDEVFDRVLNYNGLIGHGDVIRQWVLDVYGVDLSEMTYCGREIKLPEDI